MTSTNSKGLRERLVGQWNDLGRKTAELGECLPAAGFEEAPAPGARSAGEVFRHLAFWNSWLAATARGESPDGAANELPKKAAPTKAKALAAFSASVEEAARALASAGKGEISAETAALYTSFLGHTAEHYGQLAVYARLRGIVPPASR